MKINKKLIIILLFSGIIGGCASGPMRLTDDAIRNLKGKSIVAPIRPAPDIRVVTLGRAVFFGALAGGFGTPLAAGIGGALAGGGSSTEDYIPDPAVAVKKELLSSFAQKNGMTINSSTDATNTWKISKISKQYQDSDYVLDIFSGYRQVIYYLSNLKKYQVINVLGLSLIETKTSKVVARANCKKPPYDVANAPTYNELFENKAQWVKDEMKLITDYCIANFKSSIGI